MTIADTDFIIDLLHAAKRHHDAAVRKAEELEGQGVLIRLAAPTRFELALGAGQYVEPEAERLRIMQVAARFPTIPLTGEAADRAGAILASLAKKGRAIGVLDALVAGIALEEGEPVLTRNTRDFGRVEGLSVVRY